jgi:4-amino-4-deoxy-L-arabinose transferase-like glycosyltransferase
MAVALTSRERRGLWAVIGLLAAVRLATLAAYPVMDMTESRYAEIARKMLETGDWLMPQFAYGVPFWGKPPLSTWLAAASMAAFGVNEFAARLPSLLLLLGCGALVFRLAGRRAGRDAALLASTFFATTLIVFIAGGAVMTDAALLLGTTLAMAGFWIAVDAPGAPRRIAGFAFFVGLAIGMMAKGPIALVLTFVPIGGWTLWTRSWRSVWTRLPWVAGTLLAAALVLPWYLAAERASPGFLDYFLVGEHWKRFVEPGWKGDLYGGAHARPHGTIWLFWIAAALPWSLPAMGWLVRALVRRRDALRTLATDPWQAYLLLWAVAPMLFFTLSGNILATYVLPGIPALALLLATLWRQPTAATGAMLRAPARHAIAAGLVLAALAVGVILAMRTRFETELSHRTLVRTYEATRTDAGERLIYLARKPTSADFYSRGRAIQVGDTAALLPYLADDRPDFIVVRARDLTALPPAERTRLLPSGSFGEYRLLREPPD